MITFAAAADRLVLQFGFRRAARRPDAEREQPPANAGQDAAPRYAQCLRLGPCPSRLVLQFGFPPRNATGRATPRPRRDMRNACAPERRRLGLFCSSGSGARPEPPRRATPAPAGGCPRYLRPATGANRLVLQFPPPRTTRRRRPRRDGARSSGPNPRQRPGRDRPHRAAGGSPR